MINSKNYIKYATHEYVDRIKTAFVIQDSSTGYIYAIRMTDGKLHSDLLCSDLQYSGEPIVYCEGQEILINDLSFNLIYPNGDIVQITGENLICSDTSAYIGLTSITVEYDMYGFKISTEIPVSVVPFDPEIILVDFEYIQNDDGTYTITDWKQTLNGEPSTEVVIPYNSLIIL